MNDWLPILLPFFLVLARVSAFVAVLPLFSWSMLPMQVRLAIALLLTIFFAYVLPGPDLGDISLHWLAAAVLITREVICGLALGLAGRLIFISVQQGLLMGTQQMGFMDAGIIDPSTGDSARPMAMLFQMLFAALFLAAGGHQLLLLALERSYDIYPVARPAGLEDLVAGLIDASSVMLLFALKLAAPLLAGFLLLSVILGVIARVMPEMNVLMASLPLRVGMGMVMSLAVLQTLNGFVTELTDWLDRYLLLN